MVCLVLSSCLFAASLLLAEEDDSDVDAVEDESISRSHGTLRQLARDTSCVRSYLDK